MRAFKLAIGLLAISLCSAGWAQESGAALGEAYTVDDAQLLYTESHQWSGSMHTIEYRKPDGALIASSQIDFSHGEFSPAYTEHYVDSSRSEGVRWLGQQLILFDGVRETVAAYHEPLTINTGFYHFIRRNWDVLISGKVLDFEFAMPSRQSVLKLRIYRINPGQSNWHGGDANWIYFRVDSRYLWLRGLVPSLTAAFDSQQRLVWYRGIANVRDDNGDIPQVSVHYRYPTP